jgi:hypothetical protein
MYEYMPQKKIQIHVMKSLQASGSNTFSLGFASQIAAQSKAVKSILS